MTALYVFATAGLGLCMATIARNMAQVGMLMVLILAPLLFLSGVWSPPEAMPWVLRDAMVISPMHYYIDASFGILLKGAGLDLVGHSIASLAAPGAIVFAFGMWRFRRQFSWSQHCFELPDRLRTAKSKVIIGMAVFIHHPGSMPERRAPAAPVFTPVRRLAQSLRGFPQCRDNCHDCQNG